MSVGVIVGHQRYRHTFRSRIEHYNLRIATQGHTAVHCIHDLYQRLALGGVGRRLDGDAFTYVFADLRGYGLSIELTGACTVEEIAADCLALADRLGWQRFHVVGHSMTGMITQRLAADAPSRVISAIAVCPISAAGNRLGPEALAFFASTADDDEALRRLFQFVSGGLSDAWARAKVRHNRATVAPACRGKYLDMLVTAAAS